MQHVIPVSGKDSLTTAIVQRERRAEAYIYFYNHTGAELPEIDNWLTRCEVYLNAPIKRIGADLTEIIYAQGILPSRNTRFCTRIAKIQPMEKFLEDDAVVYFGLRADEPQRVGYESKDKHITAKYPLREMGIGLSLVYRILGDRDLMPPDFFWQRLFEDALDGLGFMAAEITALMNHDSPIIRYALRYIFNWRKRPNCFYCFNQQPSEMLGLMEHHPTLFQDMMRIENEVGGDGYYWRSDWPLSRVELEANVIYERRLSQAIRECKRFLAQYDVTESPDLLSYTTCGLFCGK
jgi:hypothetical protein